MTDVLVRDIPESTLAAIDAKARRLGISRQEFLRRRVMGAGASDASVEPADLQRSSAAFQALADTQTMERAWR